MNGLDLSTGVPVALSSGVILTALLVALALGVVVALVYRLSLGGRPVSPAMQGTLVLLAMIAAIVMMVIGNNLARAFSLVGALAIIRFRTRLRSPWDITFVFLSLAVGIAAGVFAFRVAFLGTLTVTLAVLALYLLPAGGVRRKVRLLRCDVAAYENVEGEVDRVLDRFLRQRWLVEARSLRFGETLSYRYRVVLRDEGAARELLRAVADLEGVERVVLADDEDAAGPAE